MPVSDTAKLIVISGPAGSGKTTLCDRLLADVPGVRRVVTSTTRDPREGEQHGIDYTFFTPEQFEAKLAAGKFYEHAKVHGRYYGTLKKEVDDKLAAGHDVLLNIDVQGAAAWRKTAAANPALAGRLVTIYISVSPEQMKDRMLGRGDTDDSEISRRLKSAVMEQARAHEFDHVITSADKESDYRMLRTIYASLKE